LFVLQFFGHQDFSFLKLLQFGDVTEYGDDSHPFTALLLRFEECGGQSQRDTFIAVGEWNDPVVAGG